MDYTMDMQKTILVVDDKANVRTLLREYLTEQGYRVVVAENGRLALFTARQEKPDLILLDIMMPEMNGTDFMRTYRKEADTPIILLTAKLEETDKVLGLELGADDYITKPFSMRELVARVRAVLRRTERDEVVEDVLQVADVVLDKNGRRVTVSGQAIDLTPSEYDLLLILMSAPGRAIPRLELLEHLQGTALEGAEKTINVHIRNLRTKIEPDPSNPRYIETVFGVGYRFCTE
jgi:DNA-binding response OmpR family regulator